MKEVWDLLPLTADYVRQLKIREDSGVCVHLIKTKVLNLEKPLISLSDEELQMLDEEYLSYLKQIGEDCEKN